MRLLLAEDDAVLGPAVKQALQSAGFAVDLVADGDEAFLWVTRNRTTLWCWMSVCQKPMA